MSNVVIAQRENYCKVQFYKNIYHCCDSSIHAVEILLEAWKENVWLVGSYMLLQLFKQHDNS